MKGFRDWIGDLPRPARGSPGGIMVVMVAAAAIGSLVLLRTIAPAPVVGAPALLVMDSADPGVVVDQIPDDFFEINAVALRPKKDGEVARRAAAIPADSDVVVIGYADERGGDPLNDRLSSGRAATVGAILSRAGHRPARTIGAGKRTAGRCAARPAAEREACWAHDRRVEIWRRPGLPPAP